MDFPHEILIHIFKYISKSDRKAASETCRAWYEAANAHCFRKNKVVLFYKSILNNSDERSPTNIFEDSPVMCNNYMFHDVELTSKQNDFWDKLGDHITKLTLKSCDICEKVFAYILDKCQNLETLNVESCKDLFMSGRLLEGKTEGLLVNNLEKLKCLSLSGNQYLTDSLLNRFASASPQLEELNLSFCNVQFHLGLVRKFYPAGSDVFKNPSESVLTFHFILKLITARAQILKHFNFSSTLIDGLALKSLAEVPDLKLESLILHCCDQLTNTGIEALTLHQSNLKELDLALCNRVTDQSLVFISRNLVNLETLNIQRCRAVTDLGLEKLKELKKLKSLNISECELITNHGLLNGICIEVNNTLRELDIHSLNFDEAGLILMSERLPELRFLDVSYCFNAVTDKSIQVIFQNQILLRTLKMSRCDKVSDAGLTGMGRSETNDNHPILPYCEDGPMPPKIHLGSRAEEEIVRDARRKHDVMMMCENLSNDTYSGHNLSCIKGLRELDISNCNRITDVGLTYAFNLKELVDIDLNQCQQITQEGMEHLVKNCPSIELINLSDCYNLKDDAVVKIVAGLKRLKNLQLKGCNQLSDKTIEAVKLHCTKLQYLDIQGCRNISAELACSISLPTLHTVLMTKPGPYITDGVKNRTPPPAFLPALMRRLRLH